MSEQIKRSDVSEKDIYEFIKTSAISAEKEVEKLNNALKESAKLNNENLKKNSKASNAAEIKATENAIKLANFQLKEKLKLENDLIKIQAGRLNAETQLKNATEKSAQSIKNQGGAYKDLVIKTRDAKNESKRLGAELLHLENSGKKNTKEFKELSFQYKRTTSEAVVLDSKLKKLDSTVGDNFRNVGNYSSGIGKLKNGLMQLTAGFGVIQALKYGGSTIMDFETSIADLSAVTGQTGNDLKFLENKAIEFSKAYGTSARDVSEAFKLAGSARPELLKNGDALAKITEQAIILSKASGDDLPTSIANLTGTLNAFDLPASKAGDVMDILANASQKGAQEIPYLNEAFTKFGGVAANAGIGIAESAAAVEILGEKMPEASIAGNNLKNIMIILQTNAAKQGREFKGLTEELALMQPNLKNVTELEKLFGKENLLAAQTLIGQSDRLREFSGELGKSGTAQDQANTKSKTLSESWARLKANTEALFLEFRGGASYFTSFIDFLSSNLPTIISVVTKAGIAFITFKTIMKGMQLKDQFLNWKNLRGAIAETGTATTEAGEKAKGFGNALKGVGLTVFIALLTEVTIGFYEMATGIDQAREAQLNLNKAISSGQKFGSKVAENLKKDLDAGKKTEQQAKDRIKFEIQTSNENKRLAKERIANLQKEQSLLNEFTSPLKYRRLTDQINAQKNIIAQENTVIKEMVLFTNSLNDVNDATIESNIKSTNSTKDKTKALNEQKISIENILVLTRLLQDEQKKEIGINQELIDQMKLEMPDIEQAEERIRARRKGVAEIKVIEAELTRDEKKINEARIEQIKENLAIELENIELTEVQKLELKKRAELDIQNLEIESNKKKFENFKQYVDLTTDYFIKRSDEKIAQIDKEISAAEKQSDYLEELAKNGNITAQQSIAEQQKIINDGNLKKQKEQKRIERLKLVQTSLDIYGGKVANGDKNPLLNTVKDVQLLKLFIDSLPAFESGTERTFSNSGNGIDGKGGRLSILHEDEKVFTKEDSKKIGFNHSNAEVADVFQQYKNGTLMQLNNIDSAGNSYDLIPLLSEIKSLKRTIENRPTHNIAMGEITQSIMQIVEKTTKGNTTHVTKYNIKK